MPMSRSCKMAEDSSRSSSSSSLTRKPRERAVNLLRVVQNLLEHTSDSTTDESNTGSSSRQNAAEGSEGNINDGRSTIENFRNLFAGYSASSRNQSRSSRPPPAKRQKRQNSGFYVPKETWTHEFFCLADCEGDSVPSRGKKLELQLAGLGRKKVVFGARDNAVKVKEKLEQAYPRLQKGGGFEVLRSGLSSMRHLVVLKPSVTTGYSVKFLRDESGLGQALAYVRPLQTSLDSTPVHVQEVGERYLILLSL